MASYCEEKGKDRIIFLNPMDAHPNSSSVTFSSESEDTAPQGLVQSDGSINWNCPCLGGMAVGPCGMEFREAFECFHYSESDPKGAECLDKFSQMQGCMKQFPDLYESADDPPELGQIAETPSDPIVPETPTNPNPEKTEPAQ
ncbi:hypothetical protein TCAL_00867 [Tigriopus californicus]|uniref:CHCH domain-containing protein n=1 Tax=Tigriopus californicus TaxID=6832 RepID=A0A553NAT6_TIGCA|nr:mitochondrial intermembrane space import and assembly protein 40-like [Tigriopus californicus]TRY62538.1 hypothetical protein TCAL_00867 [Tigriopus californicus]|eukprot:TCALIF_00867-PA protein Name:"Similar to Chchd4 Mitochondrial intermembrane space import and assembly protein 40 (Mus musculus)" AED:0.34 eAED:0.34 QI:84/1/1/1/1/1/2/234/142